MRNRIGWKILSILLIFFMIVQSSSLSVLASSEQGNADVPSQSEVEYQKALEKLGGSRSIGENIENVRVDSAYDNVTSGKNPSSYDLRRYGHVSSVKSQGDTSLCSPFSIISCGESSLLTDGYNGTDFSETQLAYFTYGDVQPEGCEGDAISINEAGKNYLSIGGNNIIYTFALAKGIGAVNEKFAPFTENATYYKDSLAYSSNEAELREASWISMTNMDDVKEYLMTKGALSASIYYNESFYNYSTYSYYYPKSMVYNHAVTIVGWDDNYSKDNFKSNNQPTSNGAWLMKNSWGSDWGQGGYFWVSYEDGVLRNETAYGFEFKYNRYSNNYQYDGSGSLSYLSWETNDVYMSNIFTSRDSEYVEAVGFATGQSNLNYEIQIYKNVGLDSSVCSPINGEKVYSSPQIGYLSYAGYHTVTLNQSIGIEKGEQFSVIIKIHSDSTAVKVPIDRNANLGWVNFVSNTEKGQSFTSTNGNYWRDVSYYNEANVRVKAFTNGQSYSGPIEEVTPTVTPTATPTPTPTTTPVVIPNPTVKPTPTTTPIVTPIQEEDDEPQPKPEPDQPNPEKPKPTPTAISTANPVVTVAPKVATPAKITLAASKIKKLTRRSSNSIKITWSKTSGTKYYYVYRKVKGGKWKKIGKTTKTYYIDKKLKKGKTYSYRIRGYKKANGKSIYSKYSKTKSLKLRK